MKKTQAIINTQSASLRSLEAAESALQQQMCSAGQQNVLSRQPARAHTFDGLDSRTSFVTLLLWVLQVDEILHEYSYYK